MTNEPVAPSESPVHWQGDSANLREYQRWNNPTALLTAAVESANDAIIITEAELDAPGPRVEYVNPAFTAMTGYSQDEIRGRTPRILQGPKTDRNLIRRIRDDLRASRSFHGETVNYRKDGTEYFVEWRITPLTNDKGDVVKWVAIQRDVSERVRGEQERDRLFELERTQRIELEAQSKMKDEFLATLSHELRTPLTAIVGWSQLLLRNKKATPAEMLDGLAVIERNARSQTQLIGDLLDMSRIITGKLRLEVQRIDLQAVIKAAITAVQHAADQKQVRIAAVLDPIAGPVMGDPGRLQQVFWNLLSNSIKFSSSGGRVDVVLERVNSHVEITVADSGQGIAPEFLGHVFDRFKQADSSSTRQHGGLGLGLSISKQLVELHGGDIRAKSPGEGQGATFVVSLPVTVNAAADTADRLTPAPDAFDEVSECPPELDGLKVLVVDDETDTRQMIVKMLTNCEADVRSAASSEEALELFERSHFDVIVSDIGMPKSDGYELIRTIRKRTKRDGGDVPAVALTAFARAEDRRRALLAGFDIHVAKPVDPSELSAVVSRLGSRDRR